ncbi:MAG: hypothetical protein DRP18_03605 [Candidatus Aenigmatarchaeota archaeon]|nr:MAG: hypothetical protein DRP18_03605 [Candidatus Aenigmarchaeota archaeon]
MTLQRKYIPSSWDEIYGQDEVVRTLKKYKNISELPHLLFIGSPGVGKTACAYVLAKELDVPLVELNASDERGINVIRDKIKTLLFTSGARIILQDEADNLTTDAQAALRRPMEQALQRTNNRLILTVNRSWKIIDAISSRCSVFYFNSLSKEALTKIALRILKQEKIKFNDKEEVKKVIEVLVDYSRGDARRLVNVISNYSHNKEDLIGYIQKKSAEINRVKEIFEASINGNWEECLMKLESFIIQNPAVDGSEIVEMFYSEVKGLDIPPLKKFVIYERLGDVERNLKLQCSPLVQLSSFLASVMAIIHYK